MNHFLRNPVAVLRVVGLLEGLSFIVLVFIAMPLKYLAEQPAAVKIVGLVHGVLFVVVVGVLTWTWIAAQWPARRAALALAASLIPGGPIFIDRRMVCYAEEFDNR
ncbi:MAG TPA: DUF3817 domain-containing protein [Tepidisphaeraceae bacterium]